MSDAAIGHNGGPTFDDIVRDNRDRGLLLSMKEVIVEAVRDPRLDRRHLRILAEVIDHINSSTGAAYPGHKTIAQALRRYNVDGCQDQGYSDQVIRNSLSDLVAFGYLVSTRRAPEGGGRALAHYTIRKPSTAELHDIITTWVMSQRSASTRQHPIARARQIGADVTRGYDITRNVTQGGYVTRADDIDSTASGSSRFASTNRPPDVIQSGDVTSQSDVTSDVTSPVVTVTKEKELGESEEGARGRETPPAEGVGQVPAPGHAQPDESHLGHGVYVNGETIRHAAFAISLPGIRMGTINSGLTANEVKDRCVAHALQWAVEIEIGRSPRDVLPSKIANFLSRSIMGEINQDKIQRVREAKFAQPFGPRGSQPVASGDGSVQESKADRIRREVKERMAARAAAGGGR